MAAKRTAKEKKWFIDLCEQGCQICGVKFPSQKSNGLQFSHILSKNDTGNDEKINCLVLCPNCSSAFDIVIKPALYAAIDKLNSRLIPESWKNGEGRKGK